MTKSNQQKCKELAEYLQKKQYDTEYFKPENEIVRIYDLSLLAYYYKQWSGKEACFNISLKASV